jgi:hypothetical protein
MFFVSPCLRVSRCFGRGRRLGCEFRGSGRRCAERTLKGGARSGGKFPRFPDFRGTANNGERLIYREPSTVSRGANSQPRRARTNGRVRQRQSVKEIADLHSAKQSQFGGPGSGEQRAGIREWRYRWAIAQNKANLRGAGDGQPDRGLCETKPIHMAEARSGSGRCPLCKTKPMARGSLDGIRGGHNMQNKANSGPFGSRPFVAAWGIFLCPLKICKNRVLIGKNAVLTAPGGTRTPNPQLRRLMLYPIKLQAQVTT